MADSSERVEVLRLILTEMRALNVRVEGLNGCVDGMNAGVDGVEAELQGLRADLKDLHRELKSDIQGLQRRTTESEVRLAAATTQLSQDVSDLSGAFREWREEDSFRAK